VVVWVTSLGKEGRLMRGDFNTAQKLWYTFIIAVVPLFAITGVIRWIGPDILGNELVLADTQVHVVLAWCNDILLLVHISLKIIYPYARDSWRGIAASLAFSRLRRMRDRQLASGS
jgi:thiosulfate reductase cytochrome b subunit